MASHHRWSWLALVALCACAKGRATTRSTETAPVASQQPSPAAAASQRCQQLLFPGLTTGRAWPKGPAIVAADVRQADDARMPLDELRAILDAAVPLDPCDPSIGAWQYAPHARGALVLVDHQKLELQLFLGGRGLLTWPDGSRAMFDYGASAR